MWEFLLGADLWSNIIGGIVAALLIYLFAQLWNKRKHRILKNLTEIMGQAIEHRNIGKERNFNDEQEWIKQAKAIEENAVATAQQLSSTAGSLVQWLDKIPPWDRNSEVEKYVSILDKVIERIRELMERNS